MHAALRFGPTRLDVFTVVPGRAGDAQRLAAALGTRDPRVVAVEASPAHVLALRQTLAGAPSDAPFFVRSATSFTARHHGGDGEDPFLGAARYARTADAALVPLIASEKEPGFFERRRWRRRFESVQPGKDEREFARLLEAELRRGALGKSRAAADLAAAKRLAEVLFEEQRDRVAVVLTSSRADRVLKGLTALAPRPARDDAAEPPAKKKTEVRRDGPYPPYR